MVFTEEDIAKLQAESEQLGREIAERENGVPCVLLVSGNQYGEVMSKGEIDVTIWFHNRWSQSLIRDVEERGFKPVRALRLTKQDGSRTYLVPLPDGRTDVYSGGKYIPAPKAKA
jgi:hypothetical protein